MTLWLEYTSVEKIKESNESEAGAKFFGLLGKFAQESIEGQVRDLDLLKMTLRNSRGWAARCLRLSSRRDPAGHVHLGKSRLGSTTLQSRRQRRAKTSAQGR